MEVSEADEDNSYRGASLKLDNVDGMERFTFTFGVPTSSQGGRSLVIELPLILTTFPDLSWRIPANSEVIAPKPAAGKPKGKSGKKK